MRLLSLETTCDETGAAVLEGEPGGPPPIVRSSIVASQFDLHQRFGGVVPEIASRAHVRQILPVIDEALHQAGLNIHQIEAIAVATRPGLVGSLVIGLTAAKTLAMALDVPLVAFDHLEGHLYAAQLAEPDRPIYPCVGLVVSGGHSHLFRAESPIDATLLGGTIDDAAGEAFDKVASLLGLPHPGGPNLERLARTGNPKAHRFPRAFLRDDRLEFSFSGLKTAVLYALKGQDATGSTTEISRADLAASFQEAVVDVIAAKARQALQAAGLNRLVVGGGVAANGRLRQALEQLGEDHGYEVRIPPLSWCTDNAALGGVAFAKLAAGQQADLGIDVTPGLIRPGRGSARSTAKPAGQAGGRLDRCG